MSGSLWSNSTYLDYAGYGLTTATTPEGAFGFGNGIPATGAITVALVLPRLNDPTSLLGENWAARQATLDPLIKAGLVGATYGADPAQFSSVVGQLNAISGATVLGVGATAGDGYLSSAASRTVWVTLNAGAFNTLFGTPLLAAPAGSGNSSLLYWDGTLTPSVTTPLAGMWIKVDSAPPPANLDSTPVTLQSGSQGVANTPPNGQSPTHIFANQVAAEYDFPLTGGTVGTGTVGLIEPAEGDDIGGGVATTALEQYRMDAGLTNGQASTVTEGSVEQAPGYSSGEGDERSLDLGVIATASPNSNIVTFAGAGDVYSTMQEAVWGGSPIGSLSSSFSQPLRSLPGSPFYAAYQGLYTDAALNNISVFESAGDGGSSEKIATGLPMTDISHDSAYAVVVGGTSTSSLAQVQGEVSAINKPAATLATNAIAGNVAALEQLTSGGLTTLPTSTAAIADFLQTTWNTYKYTASTQTVNDYTANMAGAGGVDTNLAEPSYQSNDGINVATLSGGTPGKGIPDVSALAGGNTDYNAPANDLSFTSGANDTEGTSAAAPLWASLAAQFQAIFQDQGLPTTGYFNDLLYQAAAIDPGAFNDVTLGNNTSSFVYNASSTVNDDGSGITPTGLGYTAGPGYDLTTGLGTPDGILLARALTQIAQAQIYNPNAPAVSDVTGQVSGAKQTLIVQPTLVAGFTGTLSVAGQVITPASIGSGTGWSAQIAQQVLQSYFDPNLVLALAGQSQTSSTQISVSSGQLFSVGIGGSPAVPTAQQDTAAFGFVTEVSGSNAVTLARPLGVAETAGGGNGQTTIVRIRQDSPDRDSLGFYRVDDLTGSINGIAPGQAGYAAAAATRLYATGDGGTSIADPANGQFKQSSILGVNNGDIIGFTLTDATAGRTYYGLASQNGQGANALWAYGADTWGFQDGSAGAGASNFSDAVFQLDFTSDTGHDLIAYDTTPACYVEGTLIATPDGEVPVEALTIGEPVTLASGGCAPVRWIGRRSYAGRFLLANPAMLPVRFLAGSLGDGLPRRDLLVSSEHAMFIDGYLVPAWCLVNDTTIVREGALHRVDYFHVELDRHAVLLAEGAASESFLDDGSRHRFHNASEFARLYPGAPGPGDFCAPRIDDGYTLEAIRQRLAGLIGGVARAA